MKTTIIALICLNTVLSSPAQNLLTNASFEIPGDAGTIDEWAYIPDGSTALSGWLTIEDGVEYFDPSRSEFGSAYTFFGAAHEGSYILDLAPYESLFGGGIQQSFPTVVGQQYEVDFYMGTLARHGREGTANLTASIASVTHDFSVTNLENFIVWSPKNFRFTATNTNTTLTFTSFDNPNFHFTLLDDVSVTPSSTNATLIAGFYLGLQITGKAGRTYVIEYSNSFDSSKWYQLAYVTLPTSTYMWYDKASPSDTHRVYRAIEVPDPNNP